MDIENKLDEDFLFYLGFTGSFNTKLTDCADKENSKAWLNRLCGEPSTTIEQKRNRNIFLSNLVLNMQEGKLSEPFTLNPADVDFQNACQYFRSLQQPVTTPQWLDEVVQDNGQDSGSDDEDPPRDDGRTYVATRSMPGGQGAFAYVAVSLADEEPRWLGGGEGVFDAKMEEKFNEFLPPQNEMEMILARRKDPAERQRVLTFYDVMLQNIEDELDEKMPAEDNVEITNLLDQLVLDLQARGQYEQYQAMNEKEQRMELLLVLHDRAKARRNKIAKREEILDHVQNENAKLPASFFETSATEEDKYELPATMWEHIINRPPNKRNMEGLQAMYPAFVIEKYMELISNQKEEIAVRMQQRHNNICSQMRRELRREGEKLKKLVNDSKVACDQVVDVLKAVKGAYEKQRKFEAEKPIRKKGGETEKTKLYNEMRSALNDTQMSVEEEAERGRLLAEQINAVNAQSEIYYAVTDESISKTEEANMGLMRNITRLRLATQQHESRIVQIKAMSKVQTKKGKGGDKQDTFIFM